jgi:hypothetical protein
MFVLEHGNKNKTKGQIENKQKEGRKKEGRRVTKNRRL